MNNEQNGWNASAQAWVRCVDEGDVNRNHLLDPVMLDLCGDVTGKAVLDIGCGEGRFCRMLAAGGAAVTGIDPTEELLQTARERHGSGSYRTALAESLPFRDDSFDVVVSYITLVDITGYQEGIREMARVTRPGGSIVVANLTSFATATPHYWWRDAENRKQFWTLDNYMTETPRWEVWRGMRVLNWHRPLSAYFKAFLGCGLILEHFDEPMPTEAQIEAAPVLAEHGRKPDFHVMKWRKPGKH